jgi:hypothetical protein
MKPFFAVQVTDIHDAEITKIVDGLKEAGQEFAMFGKIHFEDEVTNLEAFPVNRPVIPLGGTSIVSMYLRSKLPDNWRMFYDPHLFDQMRAGERFGEAMLNDDAEFYPYWHAIMRTYPEPKFVKPTDDLKMFAGTVLEPGQTLAEALRTIQHQPIADTQPIMFASAKPLRREFRLVVVDDEIVQMSEYRNKGQVKAKKVTDIDLVEAIFIYFETVVPKSTPLRPLPRAYVMDIGELVMEDGSVQWKIVEFNCFHASGLYECDRALVFEAVAKVFE